MNYAWIENGTVVNLIWLDPANAEEFPRAVPTHGLPVRIGDHYDGEGFFRNGEAVTAHE